MADIARRSGIEVDVATLETWDPTDRTFDSVVAGQAWHWIDPVAGATKAAQVLRPSGLLAAFWHVFQPPTPVAKALAEAYQRAVPDSPFNLNGQSTRQPADLYQAMLDKAKDGIREAGGFGEPEQWRYDWEWTYTRDAWLDVLPTQGHMTQLPQDKLAEILTSVGTAIDAMGGNFTMPYTTVAAVAVRT
jgi:SAM-dependent methyltransferase